MTEKEEREDVLKKIKENLNKEVREKIVRVDEFNILIPFKEETYLEFSRLNIKQFCAILLYADEEECITTWDYKTKDEFIKGVANRINELSNTKRKIVIEKKRFKYSRETEYILKGTKWIKNDEYIRKSILVFKNLKQETIYDFTLEK